MFPIHFKLTIGTVAELQRLTAFLAADTAQAVADCPKLPELSPPADTKPAGKPKAEKAAASAAKTAPTQPTAAAAQSQANAAPEGKTEATQPGADATSAGQPVFEYETLRKKVFELLPAHGGPALTKVAKAHGFDNFKLMQAGGSPDVWQKAFNDLVAEFEGA